MIITVVFESITLTHISSASRSLDIFQTPLYRARKLQIMWRVQIVTSNIDACL
jgi:hypothetical protein